MVTGISHLQMQVRDLAACRNLYGEQWRLPEIAYGNGPGDEPVSMFTIGSSTLQLHESPDAISQWSEDGALKPPLEVPGTVGHISFYTTDNERLFHEEQEVLVRNRIHPLGDGPALQPLGHSYTQRTLLGFLDPDGFNIQISELVDPREQVKERLALKRVIGEKSNHRHLQGIDHINLYSHDVEADRDFLGRILGLEDLHYRTETIPPVEGFQESIMGAGMTELEVQQSDASRDRKLGPGVISGIGFWSDDMESTYQALKQSGELKIDRPPRDLSPLPTIQRPGFCFSGLGGLRLEISQADDYLC